MVRVWEAGVREGIPEEVVVSPDLKEEQEATR